VCETSRPPYFLDNRLTDGGEAKFVCSLHVIKYFLMICLHLFFYNQIIFILYGNTPLLDFKIEDDEVDRACRTHEKNKIYIYVWPEKT
jgi:hypothetical protein